MVKTPEEYKWSSYQAYTGKRKPPEWLHRDFILKYFGKNYTKAEKNYKDFVMRVSGKTYDSPLKGVFASTILGDAVFYTPAREQTG